MKGRRITQPAHVSDYVIYVRCAIMDMCSAVASQYVSTRRSKFMVQKMCVRFAESMVLRFLHG